MCQPAFCKRHTVKLNVAKTFSRAVTVSIALASRNKNIRVDYFRNKGGIYNLYQTFNTSPAICNLIFAPDTRAAFGVCADGRFHLFL